MLISQFFSYVRKRFQNKQQRGLDIWQFLSYMHVVKVDCIFILFQILIEPHLHRFTWKPDKTLPMDNFAFAQILTIDPEDLF
ncbi:hypothetical protein SAMN05444748_105168 [Variovorax sp. OV700]|nr:hypothetical protein SAMN05444748_105168 [Variovorax sp. OV700]